MHPMFRNRSATPVEDDAIPDDLFAGIPEVDGPEPTHAPQGTRPGGAGSDFADVMASLCTRVRSAIEAELAEIERTVASGIREMQQRMEAAEQHAATLAKENETLRRENAEYARKAEDLKARLQNIQAP